MKIPKKEIVNFQKTYTKQNSQGNETIRLNLNSKHSQEYSREVECVKNTCDDVLEAISKDGLVHIVVVDESYYDDVITGVEEQEAEEGDEEPEHSSGVDVVGHSLSGVDELLVVALHAGVSGSVVSLKLHDSLGAVDGTTVPHSGGYRREGEVDGGPVKSAHGEISFTVEGAVMIVGGEGDHEKRPVPESQEVVQLGGEQSVDDTISGQELHLVKHFLKQVSVEHVEEPTHDL